MTEEEKEAIKELKHYRDISSYYKEREYTDRQIEKYINIVLNLIGKQQNLIKVLEKENDSLKKTKIIRLNLN